MPTPSMRPTIAVSCGEPAGIGPEIALRAAWEMRAAAQGVLLGDAALLSRLAGHIDSAIDLVVLGMPALRQSGLPPYVHDTLIVVDCPASVPVVPGTLDVRNSRAVLDALDLAIEGAQRGEFNAIVTAPVQKSVLHAVGAPFTGHTEYLAQKTGTRQVVMMLTDDRAQHSRHCLRVALATTHLPLKEVPAAITVNGLLRTLEIVDADLRTKFGIAAPRILVAGLNPHAGEDGHLGREEIEVIRPALQAAQALGIDASGPYPADTLFQPKYLERADCVLAMYHDQGLPVFKHASFGRGVNITLGLPIIRTSVDHGTALDLAALGVGHADHNSMRTAISMAIDMATNMAAAAKTT